MTEPTEKELERAERIKKLRAGEAVPRREPRRPSLEDAVEAANETSTESGSAGDRTRDRSQSSRDSEQSRPSSDGPLQPDDDLDLPPNAPDDLSVVSLYLRSDLKDRLIRLEKHLNLRHGFRYDGELNGPRHVRPLALYLGVRQLDKLDAEEIYALFESIEEIESP